jgi:2-polyprenyl-3-methyl-5-hydroxy-6-metoxy-1,4-benzoquinol methylase
MKPPIYDPSWPDDVKAVYKHDMEEIWDRDLAPHLWNQYHNLLDTYLRIAGAAPLDILDVGCAQGTLALLLAEMGHRVTAVDIRPQFIEYAKTRYTEGDITFVEGNVLETDIHGEYDLIFANQIIEHVVYPVEMLVRLKRLLRPGGRVVTATPNGEYVRSNLPSYTSLGDAAKWEHLQHTADGDGHFFLYVRDELRDIFVSAGLSAVNVSFLESPLISGHMKVRYCHRFMPVGLLRFADRILLSVPKLDRRIAHQLLATGVRGPE